MFSLSKKYQKAKKQHFVPKTYLKNFCERKKTINVFDKEQLTKFPANINKVACDNYFYDIEAETPEQEQAFERLLSDFETVYGKLIKEMFSKLDNISLIETDEVKNVEQM